MDNTESNKSETAKREEKILKFWEENKIFEKTLSQSEGKEEFVFYEGPPTANGKPGIHHLEARAFKDIIPRYKTMRGYHVSRKGGWDTHGLPVELQVEKQLGLKSKKEVEAYGVEKFNKKCKESVWEYLDIWNKFTKRIGYWIDQENPYITYENSYIESVWSVFKKVEEQNLLYKDYKVVPWCSRCGTALSSHELAQGYEDVKDLSVTVKFHLLPGQKFGKYETKESAYILAWTTTPWTLPGNVGLAVGEKIKYTALRIKGGEELLIVGSDRVAEVFKDKEIEIVHEDISGQDLVGLKYEPLFGFLKNKFGDKNPGAFEKAYQVYAAEFVNTEDGTGVVHTAVMYGQDDFELGTKVGLPKYHLVGEDGRFAEDNGFLSGRFVKEADEKGKPTLAVEIIEDLKKRNLFLSQENIKHSYPHCWRCKTPLIYYARDSWYIRMSALRDKLVSENKDINWVPSHIKEGRFGEWLREIKDWAISRERFWGTPLPIWQNKTGERVVIGSIDELKKHTKKSGNKYFIMRHGEAGNNIEKVYHSDATNRANTALTDNGRIQAKESIKKFEENVDIVISSPYLRSKQTAEIVCEHLNFPLDKIIYDPRIYEWKTGTKFDGKSKEEFRGYYDRDYINGLQDDLLDGESFAQVIKRVGEFIYEIESKYHDKNIFIVAHSGIIRALNFITENLTFLEAERRGKPFDIPENASIRSVPFVPLPHNENYELDLHKPYIDQLVLVDKNGEELERAKEVMDVWFDSGAMPFAQDGISGVDNIKYPADFISEAIDQTRGWFYTMHAIGILMGKGKAYKNVICLGHILDAEGKKMSKSLGNIVDPWFMMDKYGVDALRFWMYTVNQPGDSKNFDERTVDEIVKKVFNPIENILSFYQLYTNNDIQPSSQSKNVLDQWIIASLNNLLKEGTENFDEYKIFEAGRSIRDFANDFSTWYIRRSRERFKSEDVADKKDALNTTRFVLLELAKYMAPFTPFFAEYLYLSLKSDSDPESVHLCEWFTPSGVEGSDKSKEILEMMEEVRRLVSLALEKRMVAGVKVRQPLKSLKVKSKKLENKEDYLALIKDEINVKEVLFDENIVDEVELDTNITPELQKEGDTREVIRTIQDLRKQKNLSPLDVIVLEIETDDKGKKFIEDVEPEIKKPTNISEILFSENNGIELKIENYKFKFQIK